MILKQLEQVRFFRTSAPCQVKLAADPTKAGMIVGYGSVFNGEPDMQGDIIAPGAFSASLQQHKAEGTTPIMLWAHDTAEPIGKWVEIVEDNIGLAVRGQLNLDTQGGQDAHAHLKAGDINGLSVGFSVRPGGRTVDKDGTVTLTDLDLWEVSIVSFPANKRARVVEVKSMADVAKLLREGGLPRGAAEKLAAGGWPALTEESDDDEFHTALGSLAETLERSTELYRKD